MLRAATLDATTSYVNVVTALAAQTAKPAVDLVTLENGKYKNVGTVNLRISINQPGQAASDLTSFLLLPNEEQPFDETNLNNVSYKSIGAASTAGLQITGCM